MPNRHPMYQTEEDKFKERIKLIRCWLERIEKNLYSSWIFIYSNPIIFDNCQETENMIKFFRSDVPNLLNYYCAKKVEILAKTKVY
jgi:hypothetical protein